VNVPCSPTPAGPPRSATTALRCCLPPTVRRRRLPRQILISGLNHTARPLAAYASYGGLLHRHARLASGGWPALPGGADYPPGPNERFQVIPSFFPRLRLAHPDRKAKAVICRRSPAVFSGMVVGFSYRADPNHADVEKRSSGDADRAIARNRRQRHRLLGALSIISMRASQKAVTHAVCVIVGSCDRRRRVNRGRVGG